MEISKNLNNEDTNGECLSFIKNRNSDIITIPYIYIITQLTHNNNTIFRRLNNQSIQLIGINFMNTISMMDSHIINNIKVKLITQIPEWKESINFIQKNSQLNKKQFIKLLKKQPKYIKENPMITNQLKSYISRKNNFRKRYCILLWSR